VIKSTLCEWLEQNFDHKFLIWVNDPIYETLKVVDPDGVVQVSFNPTAENIAKYMVEEIAPPLLKGLNCILTKCRVEETRKCAAIYEL